MLSEGDILLFRFPKAELEEGKLRPALLLRRIDNGFDDWLVCMISTRIQHRIDGLEIVVNPAESRFAMTGLKRESLIRTSRLAVVQNTVFQGKLGTLPSKTFEEVRLRLSKWIRGETPLRS